MSILAAFVSTQFGRGTPTLSTDGVTDQGVNGVSGANARLRWGADGVLYSRRSTIDAGAEATVRDWLTPKLGMAQFEIRWTTVSGTLTTGTSGVWNNMGSDVNYAVNRAFGAGTGTNACTGNVEIRRASDGVVVAGPTLHSLTAQIV